MSAVAEQMLRPSLRDQVLVVLRQRLVAGDIAPGEILSAQAVAAELGVSGSPVREAMLTLVNQGVMEPVRNRGFRVVELSDADKRDIYEMRVWLEVPAMVKLCGSPAVEQAHAEYALIARDIVNAARASKLVDYLEHDRRFHLGLLAMLGNRRLVDTVGLLRDQTRLFGLYHLSETGDLVRSAEEHADILGAMVAGDRPLTERLMLAHLAHVRGDWA